MDTGQSHSATLRYEQAQLPIPGFPPSSSGPSKYGAFSGPQQQQPPANSTATNLAARPEQSFSRPARVYSPQEVPANIKSARSSVEYGLGQLRSLQLRRYRSDEVGVEERLRILAASVLGDLRALRGEVSDVLRAAERHRWRKWLLGGVV